MLPVQGCFAPYRNSMADMVEQIKQPQEETWQEKEHATDKYISEQDWDNFLTFR